MEPRWHEQLKKNGASRSMSSQVYVGGFSSPRRLQDTPRRLQDAPRRANTPQDAPKMLPSRPKWCQDAAKRLPRGAQEANLARKIEKK